DEFFKFLLGNHLDLACVYLQKSALLENLFLDFHFLLTHHRTVLPLLMTELPLAPLVRLAACYLQGHLPPSKLTVANLKLSKKEEEFLGELLRLINSTEEADLKWSPLQKRKFLRETSPPLRAAYFSIREALAKVASQPSISDDLKKLKSEIEHEEQQNPPLHI